MNILSCTTHSNNYQLYTSIKEVPKEVWTTLQCEDSIYLSPDYLEALENHNPNITFAYLVLLDEANTPTAFTTIQIVDFYLESVQNDMQSIVDWVKCMGRKLRIISPETPFKVLTSGNIFVSGEHGIFIKQDQDKQQIIKDVAKALVAYSNSHYKGSIDAYMLKDFLTESLYITDELKDDHFNSFQVEPNMILSLDKSWNTFDDYLAAMRTKFRVKAKKAMKQSDSLRIEDISIEMLDELLPQMTTLYKTVTNKAGFNLGDFDLETYKCLKQNLEDQYLLKGYWLENKLVGFMSGIINQDTLDAHFVGIDYKFNKSYAIYQRMLYDYIILGIEQNVNYINFGRTASEIKSSVGAVPQDLTIYLRHKKTIPNKILSLFLNKIKPTAFKQKLPFKEVIQVLKTN
ncbi:GNAT family N-acetyltransferase [Tenacibaculum holothuriorum]|uniref:GNAT family N-acetyltransferase n=1 Tax=Tenacibaculum holothuriorum TaxID=1635173 RepID=UPI001E374EEF|nr:GNAT family N-acetyltransferase [Tenacibaculum holothuriorum]